MKPKRVIARRLALQDIEEAVDHYLEADGASAAQGFIDALEKAYAHISRHPATGSPRLGHELNLPGLRVWPLTRYPQLVMYVEGHDHIDVWRVLHGRRDVPQWLREPEG